MLRLLIAAVLVASCAASTHVACTNPSSTLTQAQRTTILNKHNELRGGEGSSNMLKMTWSASLERRAQQLAKDCVFAHAVMTDCDGNSIGQNIFANYGSNGYPAFSYSEGTQSWFDEKNDYTLSSKSCAAGKVCGHYTQVVWAKSTEVGCAMVQCPTLGGINVQNGNFLVCDYAPAGNFNNESPFEKGSSCSGCTDMAHIPAGYTCDNNLCAPCTKATNQACVCPSLNCQNGGQYDSRACVCQCAADYIGKECEVHCSDAPGAPCATSWNSFCSNDAYHAFMYDNCKKTCGMC